MGSVLGFDTQMDQVDGCVVIGNFLGSYVTSNPPNHQSGTDGKEPREHFNFEKS